MRSCVYCVLETVGSDVQIRFLRCWWQIAVPCSSVAMLSYRFFVMVGRPDNLVVLCTRWSKAEEGWRTNIWDGLAVRQLISTCGLMNSKDLSDFNIQSLIFKEYWAGFLSPNVNNNTFLHSLIYLGRNAKGLVSNKSIFKHVLVIHNTACTSTAKTAARIMALEYGCKVSLSVGLLETLRSWLLYHPQKFCCVGEAHCMALWRVWQ